MTEAEFLPLFDQYRPMVYGLALSYTRSPQDAEDVCQEVFLTLLEKPPAPGKERPWLARVAVNRCRDLLTSPWRRRRENDDTALERLTFETPEEAGLFAALEGSGLEPKRLQFAAHRPDCPPRLALVEAVRQGRPGLEVLPVRYRNTL